MSTNTRVLRNITNFKVTPPNASSISVISVRRVALRDDTGMITAGSDNDAYAKKFASWLSFSGEIVCEDPMQLSPLTGLGDCQVDFTAVDINTKSNVNVTGLGVMFTQPGIPSAEFGQEATPTMTMNGGSVTYAAA